MFCTACAAHNPISAHRCTGCGRQLAAQPVTRDAAGPRPFPWSRRLAALILVPLIVLVGLAGGSWYTARADLAAAYNRATEAVAAGYYDEALDAFTAAGDYRDAAAWRADLAARLAPHRAAYDTGIAALDAGNYDSAIGALLPVVRDLPNHEDAAARLEEARRLRATALLRRADEAETRRDWQTAEGALAELAAAAPGDEEIAARLATLRREHAPIAFIRDDGIYLIGPDEADERLVVRHSGPIRLLWSPDRTHLAFLAFPPDRSSAGVELYVVDLAGTAPVRIGKDVHPDAVPVWSPDGSRIAYTSVASYDLRDAEGLYTIHMAEVATGRETDLTTVTRRHAMTPTWSPTGDRLAFVSRMRIAGQSPSSTPGEVYVLELATGEIANRTRGRVPGVARVLWSPRDDRLLLYTQRRGDTSMAPSDTTSYLLLDAHSGVLSDATDEPADRSGGWNPVWSPDGMRFAYLRGRSTVVVQRVGGAAEPYDLDTPLSGGLSWSPDGLALLAFADDPSDPSVIVPLDGQPPTPIRLQFDNDVPTWSPVNPTDLPTAPTVAGTARDPAP